MVIFLPNIKNDPKMKPKMSQKLLKNGYHEQPYYEAQANYLDVSDNE